MEMNTWLHIPIIEDNADKAATFDESLEQEKPFILLNETMGDAILIEYWLLPVGRELPEEGLEKIEENIRAILPDTYTQEENPSEEKAYNCHLNSQIGTINGITDKTYAKEIAAEIQEIIHMYAIERDDRKIVEL